MQLTTDLSGLHPAVARSVIHHLQREDRAHYVLGLVEQRRLKNFMDAAAVPGMNTNIGRQSMVLSRDQWLRCMNQFGQMCFADSDFAKWLLKKNEDFRVKDVGTRIQSGWTPQSKPL